MEHPIRMHTLVKISVLTTLLSACGPALDTQVAARQASSREAGLARQIHASADAYRQRQGKPSLADNRPLAEMARQHSEFLRANRGKFGIYGTNISHYGVEQRALAAKQMYGIDQISENVAAAPERGPATADYLMNLWVNSPTHENNLSNSWSSTGVGVVIDTDGTVFATQIFGSRAVPQSQMSMINRLRVH